MISFEGTIDFAKKTKKGLTLFPRRVSTQTVKIPYTFFYLSPLGPPVKVIPTVASRKQSTTARIALASRRSQYLIRSSMAARQDKTKREQAESHRQMD